MQNQLKDIKDDSERRVAALERRNLDLETSLHQINAQYNLLNEKSGKMNQTDEQLRKVEHEFGSLKG